MEILHRGKLSPDFFQLIHFLLLSFKVNQTSVYSNIIHLYRSFSRFIINLSFYKIVIYYNYKKGGFDETFGLYNGAFTIALGNECC
jgi:hypothetical protein